MKKFLTLLLLMCPALSAQVLPTIIPVTELGRVMRRLPGVTLPTATDSFTQKETPLNFAHISANYTQGGSEFVYPIDWFKRGPNVQVSVQGPFDVGNPATLYLPTIGEESDPSSTVVRVAKLVINAGLVAVTEAETNEVVLHVWSHEQPDFPVS